MTHIDNRIVLRNILVYKPSPVCPLYNSVNVCDNVFYEDDNWLQDARWAHCRTSDAVGSPSGGSQCTPHGRQPWNWWLWGLPLLYLQSAISTALRKCSSRNLKSICSCVLWIVSVCHQCKSETFRPIFPKFNPKPWMIVAEDDFEEEEPRTQQARQGPRQVRPLHQLLQVCPQGQGGCFSFSEFKNVVENSCFFCRPSVSSSSGTLWRPPLSGTSPRRASTLGLLSLLALLN